MTIETYLTEEGLKSIEEELNYLKTEKRPEVINALKEARALGDLSENAEYDAARAEQATVEAKIVELEQMIEHAVIIKEVKTDKVSIQCDSLQNELIKYKPINLEDVYKNIISLIQFHIINNNSEENLNKDSSLLNKNKSFYYRHKGILLCGNSGIGKTHMFNCIKANYLKSENINYFDINIYKDLQIPDKSTNFIKSIFLFSKLLSPTVIFIENIDKIFPNNSSSNEDNSTINNSSEINLLLSEFILQMEKMSPNIILLASCEMASKLNPILTKLGFFDYNISLPLPNYNQRKNIIEYILKDFKHNLQEIDINNLSDKSHGFVPGDFVKLFKEAFLKSELSQINIITKDLINNCLGDIKPINLKDIIIDVPRVKWEEIGGNKEIINKIRQSIEWPLKNPEAFKRLGIQPPNGTLLYGPPGCSKTLIAKALATESGLNFFAVKGPELFSKYVGDSEKAVRDIFKKARMSSPSIIFFDEIDAMASSRSSESSGVEDKVLCQLLNEMDGIEGRGKVILFGATNRPDILDKALIRPGRFDRLIYIPPPDEISREEIFKICFKNMKIEKDIDFHELATKTQFFSGADIAKVAREAGMLAIADNINCEYIDKKFILQSIETTKPIINKEMINYFEDFAKKSNEQ